MAPGWYSREFCVLSAQLCMVIRGLFNFHKMVLGTSTQLALWGGITITGSSLTASQWYSSKLISGFLSIFVGRWCRACWVASFQISWLSCRGKKHAFQTRFLMHSGVSACMYSVYQISIMAELWMQGERQWETILWANHSLPYFNSGSFR